MAVLFDALHAARGHGLYTYAVRVAGLWIALVLLALALPAVPCRILASAGAAEGHRAWRGLIRFVVGRGRVQRGGWPAVRPYRRRDAPPGQGLANVRFLA